MPIRFPCPFCEKILKVDDKYAGHRSKCPACATIIMVPNESVEAPPPVSAPPAAAAPQFRRPAQPAAPPATSDPFNFNAPAGQGAVRTPKTAPSDEDRFSFDSSANGDGQSDRNDDFDANLVRHGSSAGWRNVSGGLTLIWWGTLVWILSVVGAFAFLLLGMAAGVAAATEMLTRSGSQTTPYRGGGGEALIFMIIVIGGFYLLLLGGSLTGHVLRVIGFVRCLFVPDEARVKGLAITALCCEFGWEVAVGLGVFDAFAQTRAIGPMGNLIHLAAWIAGLVCLLLFLRGIGRFLNSAQLPAQVTSFAIWLGITVGTYIVATCGSCGLLLLLGASVGSANRRGGSGISPQDVGILAIVVGVAVALVIIGLYVFMIVKYLGLLSLGSSVISRRLRRTGTS